MGMFTKACKLTNDLFFCLSRITRIKITALPNFDLVAFSALHVWTKIC